ncbi:MAG: hypothetical protein PHC64_09110 [Candidatus Gastranaerophilales bacterium]|nr:hypothetical protein [Candidatus Gastranaerophilales bacterium]
MRQAPSWSHGLVHNYRGLLGESKHVNKAFEGIIGILEEYQGVVQSRGGELARMNPPGSSLPLIGLQAQMAGLSSGVFKGQLMEGISDLFQDYEQIEEKYLKEGLTPIVEGYLRSSQYLLCLSSPLSCCLGVPEGLREKLQANIGKNQEAYMAHHAKVKTGMRKMSDALERKLPAIIEMQLKRQGGRTIKKAVMKVLTSGLGS